MPGVEPSLLVPADHVVALVEPLEEAGHLLRRILEVGVHGEDHIASRRGQAGHQCGRYCPRFAGNAAQARADGRVRLARVLIRNQLGPCCRRLRTAGRS